MAQRFHEQSEDRNLSFSLSFFLALGITHHAIVERVQVTKASCKRSQRDGARRLGSFFCFVCSRIDRLCLASSFADLFLL